MTKNEKTNSSNVAEVKSGTAFNYRVWIYLD